MGTQIQKLHIQDSEWGEYPGCNEMLTLSAPDKISFIHRAYLEAGANVIETNTFGANRIVLSEYGLEERTREINEATAQLAVYERDQYINRDPSKGPVYVAGSLGPGTKLPSLGQANFDTVYTSYYQQAYGLIEGEQSFLSSKHHKTFCKSRRQSWQSRTPQLRSSWTYRSSYP